MPDTLDRTIYKLEIDDSAYTAGVESMLASTKKLTDQQKLANDALTVNQAALKKSSEYIVQTKKDLDTYTGTNERYRQQLQKSYQDALDNQKKLTELVGQNQKAYADATKAAQQFADVSASAAKLPTIGNQVATPANILQPQVSLPKIQTDLGGLPEAVSNTSDEFAQLAQTITLAEDKMSQLNSESAEFKLLAPIVEQGKNVLQQYGNTVAQVGEKHISLRQQILNNNNELARLEETGQGTTQVYIQLEKETANLSRLYQEQRNRVRILASDTRAFDFGKAAVESAVSSYQLFTSISILAGGASEKLQKETLQLFAAMQLLTGLEQLANQTKRGGVIATNLQAASQAIYTATVGASTGALKAFRLALLGTGIGAAIVGIGFLIVKYRELTEAQEKAKAEAKLVKEVNDKAVEGYAAGVSKLEILKRELDNLNLPQKERIALAKEYNKTADEGNQIDTKQINNINLLNAAIVRQIEAIKQRALAEASANVTAEKASTLFKAQTELSEKVPDFTLDLPNIDKQVDTAQAQVQANLRKKTDFAKAQRDITLLSLLKDVRDANTEFDRAANLAAQIEPTVPPPKPKKTGPTIENVFDQERKDLLSRLASLRASETNDIQKINDEFAAKVVAERARIAKLLADKKITGAQEKILLQLAVEVNQEGLNKAIGDAKKKVDDAREKLNDELRNLQSKASLDSINLIQDEFDRRAKLIDFNEQKEIEDQKASTDEKLRQLELERALKLISESDYQHARQIIVTTAEQEVNDIIQKSSNDRQDLSADIFKKSLDAYQKAITAGDLVRDEGLAAQIQKQSQRFLNGQISFENYQKNITRIQRQYESQRRDGEIQVLEDELADLDRHLAAIKDTNSKEYKDTVETQRKIRSQLAGLKTTDAQADTTDSNNTASERAKGVQQYASAVGGLADSIITFWQRANQAEQTALDRSIALQQTRVDAAQKIADRGNAQYLKSETDRLKELQVARENAARRQLAIDAALQASQILVAITGAISKIATPGIGVAETIAEIAVIVGALATGYGIVKSLQSNQPKLRKGDPYVKRGSNPSGIDTIPVMLTEGERVVTVQENKDYSTTLNAVHNRTIKPDVINTFVKNYPRLKPIPQPNYERIREVNQIKAGHDTRMHALLDEQNKLLKENNQLHQQTHKYLKSMGVSVNVDKDGLAISVMEAAEQTKKDKRL